ncbi:MAG: tetratricopeptide repeat protein [Rhodoferax sp.]|uniref:tetratricopeptide repeat protein n=1 Tax=Rhodoferax sp. TaxID=50421 RepID=UPI00260A074A|nr:tetratricopeptide repeat protein [Rhodoferax sp.]MDD5335612.1 tetratricopeptide repeat protein [Rhodoferax sp.]
MPRIAAAGGLPTAGETNRLLALFNAGSHAELERSARLLIERCPNSGFAWKMLGVSLQLQGKEGLQALQMAADLLPDEASSHSNLGCALRELGRLDDALASYRRALTIKRNHREALIGLGDVQRDLGNAKDAQASYRRALAINPNHAEAHNNLGNALRDLGHLDDAVASYRRALSIKSDYVEAHSNLGTALRELGQLADAVSSHERALVVKPDFVRAHIGLGNALLDLGQLPDAVASYRRAVAIKSDDAQLHIILGRTLQQIGLWDDSLLSYHQALAIEPDLCGAHDGLGTTLINLGRATDAVASYRRALEIKPDSAGILHNLGAALETLGQVDEAATCFQEAYELGLTGDKLLKALLLPPIMGTAEEVLRSRAKCEQNVDELIEAPVLIEDPLTQVGRTNFFLAYHGCNDRDLQVKIAKLYEKSCPALLYQSPHCASPRSNAQAKIRVGFLSKFVQLHSVSRCYGGIVEALARSDSCEVALISTTDTEVPDFVDGYPNFVGERVHLPFNLAKARAIVSALQLDVLCYLDIGMEPFSYFMAFARLARIQCVLGGHPVTTGIGNIDCFLSVDSMESEFADGHYSEKLVRFRTVNSYFERPPLPTRFKTREELGFPTRGQIYMCPMKLQKIHPEFDEAMQRILEMDANGVVVLFQDHQIPCWHTMLAQRFEKTISAEVRNRILFLPWIFDYADFVSANLVADVVLDPFHFGIGTTLIATFAVGTPIVTKPGEFLRGRVGLGFCKMLDLQECVADSTEEYARLAVDIATDPVLRQRIQAKILANGGAIYQNLQPVDELIGFFDGAIKGLVT